MTEQIVTEKSCPKCQTTKPTTEFHCNRARFDGLAAQCKECKNADSKVYVAIPKVAEHRKTKNDARYKSKGAEKMKDDYEQLKAAHVCVACQVAPARPGKTQCAACVKIVGERNRQLRIRAVAKGLCSVCRQAPSLPAFVFKSYAPCMECHIKGMCKRNLGSRSFWGAALRQLAAQDFRCAYSGDEIILGVNDSMDHVLPTARFPEMKHNITNMVWTTRQVNTMKSNYTREEFLGTIRRIVAHTTMAVETAA